MYVLMVLAVKFLHFVLTHFHTVLPIAFAEGKTARCVQSFVGIA